jgi:uncharacterized protein (TIGR00369 family)
MRHFLGGGGYHHRFFWKDLRSLRKEFMPENENPDLLAAEGHSGFQNLLGYRLAEWREDHAVVEMAIAPKHLNRNGVLHGGVAVTLLDTACGFAGTFCPIPGRRRSTMTLSLTTSFTGQTSAGVLRAVARKVAGGTRIYTCAGELIDEQGRIIAVAQGTFRYRTGSEKPEGVPIEN